MFDCEVGIVSIADLFDLGFVISDLGLMKGCYRFYFFDYQL
jgi:hypothetical protein